VPLNRTGGANEELSRGAAFIEAEVAHLGGSSPGPQNCAQR